MSAYITGTGAITAQPTFGDAAPLPEFAVPAAMRWAAREPDYATLIDSKQIRRMSRIIRMGIAAARRSVEEAGLDSPGAVVVGTSLGCIEDTNIFLRRMVENGEDLLSPTAFIHSTHNTIAGQIALLYGCQGYNSTYVHRTLSFEGALTDALMLLEEGTASSVVTGGIDELTDTSYTIMQRLGIYADAAQEPDKLNNGSYRSPVAGEGSVFFNLESRPGKKTYAQVAAVETSSFSGMEMAVQAARDMLDKFDIDVPDLLLSGLNGDPVNDERHKAFARAMELTGRLYPFKNWCGEYATSTSFAVWMAAQAIYKNEFPASWRPGAAGPEHVRSVLIHNNAVDVHHSLILVTAC